MNVFSSRVSVVKKDMVDVFGGSKRFQALRGLRGPRGIPGKPGSINDMGVWMPNTVLKNFQDNEENGCFFIAADSSKDIKRKGDNIEQWLSRSSKKFNFTSERAATSLTELANGRHALVFTNARYIKDDLYLLPNHPRTYGFICITFRTSNDHEQVLLSNFDGEENPHWHEISTTSTEINIRGMENGKSKLISIHHNCRDWTTLFIEYVSAATQETQLTYIINNDPKLTETFTFDVIESMNSGIAVGGRYDNSRFLQGDISSIEIYHVKRNNEFLRSLKDLVVKNQCI